MQLSAVGFVDSPLNALRLAISVQFLMSMAAFERLLTMRGFSTKYPSGAQQKPGVPM
jgi:hypothetical protein